MTLMWQERTGHGQPAGVVAQGQVARRLIERLKSLPEETLAALSAVATRELLMLMGRTDSLPWMEGVRYCAPEAGAPSLWLPLHKAPTISADLLQAALEARLRQSPLLLWDAPEQILPLDRPITLSRSCLDWLDKEFA